MTDTGNANVPPPLPQHQSPHHRIRVGNKIGWLLSGGLVLVVVAAVVIMNLGDPDPDPPTLAISKPGFFEPHVMKLSPAPFLGEGLMTAPGNAGDDYRQAVAVYIPNHNEVGVAIDGLQDAFKAKKKYVPEPTTLSALEKIYKHVADGAAKKEMHYARPEDIVERALYEPAYRLGLVGDALCILSDIYEDAGRNEDAEKALRVALALGIHMTMEDVRAPMSDAGLKVQGGAIGRMGDLYKKWDKDKYAPLLSSMYDYARELEKVDKDIDDKLMGVAWRKIPNPGDVFAIVERDQDPAWRVDGLLICGAIRYTHAGQEGNRKYAEKLIAQHLNDSNPFVKAAARAAHDMSLETWNSGVVGSGPTD